MLMFIQKLRRKPVRPFMQEAACTEEKNDTAPGEIQDFDSVFPEIRHRKSENWGFPNAGLTNLHLYN